MDLAPIAQSLGITPDALSRRLRRGWTLDQALTKSRYQTIAPKRPKKITPKTKADHPYRKSWDSWPMTEEQRAVNRVLMAWRR